MRLFIATLSTETNTFCSMPTAMSGFEDYFLRQADATRMPPNLMTEALHVWRARAEALGWDVVEAWRPSQSRRAARRRSAMRSSAAGSWPISGMRMA